MAPSSLIAVIESLLFVSGEALSFGRLAKILEQREDTVADVLKALANKYAGDTDSGLMLIIKDRQATLVTKPTSAIFVERLMKGALQENLSKPALEVLAIIAYRAPITRSEIEAIRGVNCSFTLRNLLLRDLIERQGNPADARGYVYSPTFRFLESLGLQNTDALPDYQSLSQDARLQMLIEKDMLAKDIPQSSQS